MTPNTLPQRFWGGSDNTAASQSTPAPLSGDKLNVSFINVGFGGSILIEQNGSHSILIDGGTRDASGDVIKYIKIRIFRQA